MVVPVVDSCTQETAATQNVIIQEKDLSLHT